MDEKSLAIAGLTAATTPLFGSYAVIVVAALLGALVSLSRQKTKKGEAWLYLFRAIVFASMLTSVAAHYLSVRTGLPAAELLSPIAFLISFVGDGWFTGKERLLAFLRGKNGH